VSKEWRATEIVWRKIAELKPHPQNPKLHPPEQLKALAAAIKKFGFDQPIVTDEHSTILKGHGRHESAGLAELDEVPTICRPGLSEDEKMALVISDNQLPQLGSWDQKLLRQGLTALAKANFDTKLLGFSEIRLATFIGGATGAGATNPDEQPELDQRPVSRKGDVWLLGEHELHCADSEKVSIEETVRLQLTDPPYQLQPEGGGLQSKRSYPKKMVAAGVHQFEVSGLRLLAKTNVFFTSKVLIPDYLNFARDKNESWDLNVMHRSAAMPNTAGHLATDLDYIVVIGSQAPARGLEQANYSKMLSLGHWERPVPWAKPVEIIAAAMEGRRCKGIEHNPLFVDLTVRRWQKWSEKKAVLQGSRKTFDAIERERTKKKPGR
jgi:ParB-like chromosome segregation protein Spo0J